MAPDDTIVSPQNETKNTSEAIDNNKLLKDKESKEENDATEDNSTQQKKKKKKKKKKSKHIKLLLCLYKSLNYE